MVTIEDIKEVKEVVVKTLHPISVQVFGSVAKKGVGTDLDLLVIIDDESQIVRNANLILHKSLKKFYKKFAIDPFIISETVFNEYYSKGSPFLKAILKEGRLLYMRNSLKEWLKLAEEELNMAIYLLNGGYFKGACYHSQQCIEKSIKVILLKKGWELEKIHSIERLISIADDYNIKIKLSDEEVVFIDSIYRGRYPAEAGILPFGEPSKVDARKAVDIAKRIFKNTQVSMKNKK